jgi:hypothetical protein
MKRRLALLSPLIILAAVIFTPGLAQAQDPAADAFINYTNPHDICNFYRTDSNFVVERESDTECLVSIGTGQFETYTQYYYSGSNWCYEMTQGGQVIYSNCVPIPSSNSFSDAFSNMHIDSENAPYIIGGGGIVVFLIVMSAVSAKTAKARALKASTQTTTETESEEKTFNPKVKRSGRAGYGWEEMETSTTEEINAKPPKGPGEGQSQGGIGLHQGGPVTNSVSHELERLAELRHKNVITQKEFELAKHKLLK